MSIHQDVVIKIEDESPQKSNDDSKGKIIDLDKMIINKVKKLCNPKENGMLRYISFQIVTMDKKVPTTN